jgi:hypothetical protein
MLRNLIFFVFSVSLLLSGCAAHQSSSMEKTAKAADVMKNSITLKPSGFHEECVVLGKEKELIYKFTTTKPVDFNIHCHHGGEVLYPVLKNRVTESGGTFEARETLVNLSSNEEIFCMMWQSRQARRVNLSYEWLVEEKGN